MSSRRPLSAITKVNFRLDQTKTKNGKKAKNCKILGSKTPSNYLLTFRITAFPVASPL